MGTGVHGKPCPGGPVPRGCRAAKARGFSTLGGVCVCARACARMCVGLCQLPQSCECVWMQGTEPRVSWVFVYLWVWWPCV